MGEEHGKNSWKKDPEVPPCPGAGIVPAFRELNRRDHYYFHEHPYRINDTPVSGIHEVYK